MPNTKGVNAPAKVILYADSTIPKIVRLDDRAYNKTQPENMTKHMRITFKNSLSDIFGLNGRITFSAKVTEGAKRVADEQLIIAEVTAPKNTICANGWVYLITNSGSTN